MIAEITEEEGGRETSRQPLASNLDSLLNDSSPSGSLSRMAPMPELPGYELLEELGRAGMGVVYKAVHQKLRCLVALKMLRDGALAAGEQTTRFCTEAQILSGLEHPHIVKILEIGEHEGRLYMALEYAEGGNLAQFLSQNRPSFAESARLIEQLARTMHHVHQKGILHRDLKPANILLQKSDSALPPAAPARLGDFLPKIADFGLGKRSDQDNTISGAILGTPSYMSPEQAQGRGREIGVATDVYALGSLLYELLTRQPPFKGATVMDTLDLVRNERPRSPRQLVAGLSLELEAICLKCLEKRPADRYASCEELADELGRALAGQPLHQTPLRENQDQRRRRISEAVAQGLKFLEGGSPREALVWFAEALRRSPEATPSTDSSLSIPHSERQLQHTHQMHRIRLGWLLSQVPRLVQMWFPATPAVRAEFSPAGGRLIAAAEDGTVRVLDLGTARILRESSWHQANVNRLSFSPDGRFLVSASDDGTARVWDPNTAEPLSPPLRHPQWVTHAAFSSDGSLVVTGSVDGTARVWEWEQGRERFTVEHGGMLWFVGFSPDGQHFATGGWNGLARLWNAQTGEPLGRGPLKHNDGVRQVVFSADGLRVATASDDMTARVWNVATGEALTLPLKHLGAVRRVAFSQDDQYLLTWTDDGGVRVWDARTGEPRTTDLPALALGGLTERSPEGRRQLECGEDGVLRLWDWGHLSPHDCQRGRWVSRRTAERHSRLGLAPPSEAPSSTRDLPRICAAPGERLLLLQSPDGRLRVHDAETGEPLTGVLPLEGRLSHAEFSEDGYTLTISEVGDRRHVWDLRPDPRPTEDLVKLVHLLTGRRLDENGLFRPIEARELAQSWHQLRERYPTSFRVEPEEIRRWHDEASQSCEAAGLWAEAVSHLDVLQQMEPASPDLWLRKAAVWERGQLLRQAAEAYGQALDRDPEKPAIWYARGRVNLRLGEWNRAGRDFTRAAASPDLWQAWYYRAVAQIHLERLTHALADLGEALKRQPRSRVCLAMRGCLFAHYGRWDQSANDFAQAWELGERRPWVLYQHALVSLRREDETTYQALARELFEQAQRSGSPDVGAWAAWVALLPEKPIVEVAQLLPLAEQARAAYSEPGSVLHQFARTLLGLALCRAGRAEEARAELSEAALSGQGSVWDWLLLAWAHQGLDQPAEARQWLRKAYRWMGWIAPKVTETPLPPRSLPWHFKLELRVLRRQLEPLLLNNPGEGAES